MSPCRRVRVAIVCLFLGTAEARAGMPSVTLADLRTAMRTGLTELVRRFVSPWPVMLAVFVDRVWASKAIARIFGVEG